MTGLGGEHLTHKVVLDFTLVVPEACSPHWWHILGKGVEGHRDGIGIEEE